MMRTNTMTVRTDSVRHPRMPGLLLGKAPLGTMLLASLLAGGVLLGSAGRAHAQEAALPAWEQLTPTQRDALVAPLRERWNREPDERARMLERAHRWQAMPADLRARAHRGMERWEHMDPAKRAQMRAFFEQTRAMPKAQRREALALFRVMLPMTPVQREQLKNEWQAMSPEQRQLWLREHLPQRGHGHRRRGGD